MFFSVQALFPKKELKLKYSSQTSYERLQSVRDQAK